LPGGLAPHWEHTAGPENHCDLSRLAQLPSQKHQSARTIGKQQACDTRMKNVDFRIHIGAVPVRPTSLKKSDADCASTVIPIEQSRPPVYWLSPRRARPHLADKHSSARLCP